MKRQFSSFCNRAVDVAILFQDHEINFRQALLMLLKNARLLFKGALV